MSQVQDDDGMECRRQPVDVLADCLVEFLAVQMIRGRDFSRQGFAGDGDPGARLAALPGWSLMTESGGDMRIKSDLYETCPLVLMTCEGAARSRRSQRRWP